MHHEGRRYLSDPQVCKRYGVSSMTLWRWDRDERLGFPPPMRIRNRKFRDLDALELWEQSRIKSLY